MIKKALFAILFIWSLDMSSAQAVLNPLGSNIISPEGTVYTITKESNQTVRRPYTSPGAFLSFSYNTWETVKGASSEDMLLPVGSFIAPQDGKIICSDRGADKGTCYLITSGKKAGFTSASVFTQQGYNFNYAMSGDVSFLPTTANIDTPSTPHKPGALIDKDGTVYLVANNGLLGLPSWDILKSWGYKSTDIISANSADRNLAVVGTLVPKQPEQISPVNVETTYSAQKPPSEKTETSAPYFQINTTQLPSATVGMAYTAKFDFQYITKGTNYASNATFTGLPTGITTGSASGSNTTYGIIFNNPGSINISGTPTTAGTYNITLNLTDQYSATISKQFILVVNPQTVVSNSADFYVTSGEIYPKLANETNAIEVNKSAIIKFTVGNKGGNYSTMPVLEWQFPTGVVPVSDSGISENTCKNLNQLTSGQTCIFAVKLIYSQVTTVSQYGSVKLVIDPQNIIDENDKTNNWMVVNFDVKAIQSSGPSITITTNTLPTATVGQTYSADINFTKTTNYALNATISGQPSGVGFGGVSGPNANMGILLNSTTISGIPTQAGTYTLTITLTDQYNPPVSKNLTLVVNSGASFSIDTTQLPSAQVNASYSANIIFNYTTSGSNYATNATFSGLPPGITTGSYSGPNTTYGIIFNNPGSINISGTPTTAGTYNITLNLTDQYSANFTKSFTLLVNP